MREREVVRSTSRDHDIPIGLSRVSVAVAGCHGWAGVTTLARLIVIAGGQSIDHGLASSNVKRLFARGHPVVLVAKGTAEGMDRAARMVSYVAECGYEPDVLAVVADGIWPEPRVVRARRRLLEAYVPTVVRVPFVASWRSRDVNDLAAGDVPRKMWRSIGRLADSVHGDVLAAVGAETRKVGADDRVAV